MTDTERGLKDITIFQNFLVGTCPPTHIYSKREVIGSLFLYEYDRFVMQTFIKVHHLQHIFKIFS